MKLFLHEEDKGLFKDYVLAVSEYKSIPFDAVLRDYFITLILFNLSKSEYKDVCVFKGGTSLSKCYPGTIERFSEDIDLTYVDVEKSEKAISKALKGIEIAMSEGFETSKINEERSSKSKSMDIWHEWYGRETSIKLEMGAKTQPMPVVDKTLRSYIHEYIINEAQEDMLEEYFLPEVHLKVLDITRTFIDKVYAVKTQAIVGKLSVKVRHLYDVVQLFKNKEIESLLEDVATMKELINYAKEASIEYVNKRDIKEHPSLYEDYNFSEWIHKCDSPDVRRAYENLHEELLYTDEKQSFQEALDVLSEIDIKIDAINFDKGTAIQ